MPKAVRVLHIADLSNIGGIEYMLIDFFGSASHGWDYLLFSPAPILAFWEEKLASLHIPFRTGTGVGWFEEAADYALAKEVDLVHLHYPWRRAKIALRKKGIRKLIEHNHGAIAHRSWVGVYKERLYRDRVDGVIAVSDAVRFMLRKRVGYPENKIRTIHNGLDFSRLAKKGETPALAAASKKVITTICRLVTVKGVDAILRSIPLILQERDDVVFWVVGDGPLRGDLEDLADRLGVGDYVRFWGRQTQIGSILAVTDIFVLASIRESFGNVLLEAGFWQKPVIACKVDGTPEVVVPEHTGVLLTPTLPVRRIGRPRKNDKIPFCVVDGDSGQLRKPLALAPQKLAEAVLRLLSDEELRKRLGENARRHVLERFSIERYRRDIEDYYLSVLTQ